MEEDLEESEDQPKKSLCPRGLQCLECDITDVLEGEDSAPACVECSPENASECVYVCRSSGEPLCNCPVRKFLGKRVGKD